MSQLPRLPRRCIPEKSIAVLPFENLSEEKANAFFTDGVQDEILTDLAKIADLKVISRTSVMQYKTGAQRNLREIAQQLGVAHLVEGSVQRVSNRVRVNAQLIDARNDAHLWAQTYDRDLADVFAIQSEIAKAIADQLQAKLSPAEKNAIEQRPTTDVAAFELYSRAKDLILNTGFSAIRAQNLRQGIDLLNQALARDPSFFAAQCQLVLRARSTFMPWRFDHTPAAACFGRSRRCKAAVAAAPECRRNASRPRYIIFTWRIAIMIGALAELEVARSTMPNAPRIFELTGFIARRRGAHEDGVAQSATRSGIGSAQFLHASAARHQLRACFAAIPSSIATIDRALSIKPDDPETKAARASRFARLES